MSAWDLFWLLFIFVPLTILWVFVLADVIRRPDLVGWEKGLWVAMIIFFPWLGALAYLIFRPAAPAAPQQVGAMPQAAAPQAAPAQVSTRPASQPTPASS
ncbi:MAG TPA: PLD nuclease N-terminal domain-containing protein [Ktedonobacterales bacterium]|jgi:hypothetical protein|nr:PLD nuclease N-terminal domain-containing protein [Ktedonobacterales bacterium]